MSVHLLTSNRTSRSATGSNDSKTDKMSNKKSTFAKSGGLLQAMMPGAKVDKEKGKIFLNVGTSKDTLLFNISGVKFETYRSTLHRRPKSPLADEDFLQKHYRAEHKDYFFDRDPDIFKSILNYLRTGELHLPSYICGAAAKAELEFWGVNDAVIERCCWTNYNSWNSTLQALNQLEHDRKVSFFESENDKKAKGCWGKWQVLAWEMLNRPNSSKQAKVYGWISLFFVVLSIFAFIAESHPSFEYHIQVLDSSVRNSSNTSSVSEENSTQTKSYRQVTVTNPVLHIIDICCVCFFAVEYIARIILSHHRIKYVRSLMGVIDFLALVPDCVQFVAYAIKPELEYDNTITAIAILRIARVLRVFRLIRHVPGLWILVYTLKASMKELLLMTVFLLVGMLFFSSLIYFVEDREDFPSIPHGFWWALITMTTVGYGDMYPKTAWGYLIGSFTALMGLLMIGFSVPVLVSNFIMYYKHVEFAVSHEKSVNRHKENEESTENSEEEKVLLQADKTEYVNNNTTQETVLLNDFEKQSSSVEK